MANKKIIDYKVVNGPLIFLTDSDLFERLSIGTHKMM